MYHDFEERYYGRMVKRTSQRAHSQCEEFISRTPWRSFPSRFQPPCLIWWSDPGVQEVIHGVKIKPGSELQS